MADPSSELVDYHRLALGLLGLAPEEPIDQAMLKQRFQAKVTFLRNFQRKLKEILNDETIEDVFDGAEQRLVKLQLQHDLIVNENRLMNAQLAKKNDFVKELEEKLARQAEEASHSKQLKRTLEQAQSEVEKAKQQQAASARKIEDLQFDVKRFEKKLSLLTEQNKNLLTLKAQLQAEREKNTTKIKTMTVQMQDKNKKIDELKKTIVGLQRDILQRENEIKLHERTIEQRNSTIEQLTFTLREKDEKYDKMEERKGKQIKSLNQEILLQQRKYETLKVNSDARIHELEQESQKLKSQLKKTVEDLTAQHAKKVKQLNDDFEMKQRKSREMRAKEVADAIAKGEKNEKSVVERYQRQIKDMSEDYEKKIADHVAAFNKLTKEKGRIQEQLKHETIVLKKDIEELKGIVVEKDERITGLLDVKLGHEQKIEQLESTILGLKQKIFEFTQNSNQQIYYLNDQVKLLKEKMKQASERDKKLLDQTVLELQTEHEIVLDSIRGVMMEQRQTQMNDLKNRYVQLQRKSEETQRILRYELAQLTAQYNGLKEVYDKKHEEQEQRNSNFISSLNDRHKYELQVQSELKEREKVEIRNKYQMQIKAIEQQFSQERANINSSFVQEKSSALTRLKNHYEAEIELIKRDLALEAKQKSNEFDRKYKTLERKLLDEQNTNRQISKQLQGLKNESKLKLQSMTELHYRNEQQSIRQKEQLEQLQIQKEQQRQEFQRCILRLQTQIVQIREEYKKKEEYLLESCKKKISVNLAQMKTFTDNMKQELVSLEEKHNYRLELLNRQYEQLQYLYQQRSSKPEDIEALKIMHRAYLQLEAQLAKEKEVSADMKKQLANREVAHKLFSSRQLDSVMRVTGDVPPLLRKKEK